MDGVWQLVYIQCDYWCMDKKWLIMNERRLTIGVCTVWQLVYGQRVTVGVWTVWLLGYGQRVTNNDGRRVTIGLCTVWELLEWIVLFLVGFT